MIDIVDRGLHLGMFLIHQLMSPMAYLEVISWIDRCINRYSDGFRDRQMDNSSVLILNHIIRRINPSSPRMSSSLYCGLYPFNSHQNDDYLGQFFVSSGIWCVSVKAVPVWNRFDIVILVTRFNPNIYPALSSNTSSLRLY